MKSAWAWVPLLVCLGASPWAHAKSTGLALRSGKQNGANCTQCHQGASTQVTVAVENTDGSAASQPLSPFNTYVLRVRGTGSGNAGFNLATGRSAEPRTQGQLVLHAMETKVRVTEGEATHNARTAINGSVDWRVAWKPPAFPSGPNRAVRVFASVRAVGTGVRSLSAVSGGNPVPGSECGPGNSGACGVDVQVAPSNCTDADGDGFVSLACPITNTAQNGGDCNDGDAQVNPAASERCNGADDDCDGQADEGLANALFYPDRDNDTFGDKNATATRSCGSMRAIALGVPGATQDHSDCNDDAASIKPNVPEVCDGVDNNCNGRTDEGFSWNGIAAGQLCDRPDDMDTCTNGVVRCVNGTPDCANDVPRPELCDVFGNDDDCDGRSDAEEFPEVGNECRTPRGCPSVLVCAPDGLGTACADVPAREYDICGNGMDDDCDGNIDEVSDIHWNGLSFNDLCDSVADADLCATGHVTCQTNRAVCLGDMPTPELCNDCLDNDCDGDTDEPDCVDTGATLCGGPTSSSSSAASTSSAAAASSTGGPGPSSDAPSSNAADSSSALATSSSGGAVPSSSQAASSRSRASSLGGASSSRASGQPSGSGAISASSSVFPASNDEDDSAPPGASCACSAPAASAPWPLALALLALAGRRKPR